MPRRVLLAALALAAIGCSPRTPSAVLAETGPRGLDAASVQERAAYLQRAQVWRSVPTGSLDLLAGPPGEGAIAFEDAVACDYVPDPHPGDGKTPKFYCALASGDKVKVKYGTENREVYAEVAATRLFWALGFGTDRQYPARVTCRNCPADPWRHPAPETGAAHTFDPAIVERGAVGTEIEVRGLKKGWAWWELQTIDEKAGGAPPAHVDALRLLAAFVQHGDNIDGQQRLACLPGGIEHTSGGNATCTEPFLFTVDLGATFSRVALLETKKFELADWERVPVWEDPQRCIAKLKRNLFTGTMENPRISEAGRAFLAGLLTQLSERQIHDLFTAARAGVDRETIRDADGRERQVTVDDWVRGFIRKRAEITEHHCTE